MKMAVTLLMPESPYPARTVVECVTLPAASWTTSTALAFHNPLQRVLSSSTTASLTCFSKSTESQKSICLRWLRWKQSLREAVLQNRSRGTAREGMDWERRHMGVRARLHISKGIEIT